MFYGRKKLLTESQVVSPAKAPNLPILVRNGTVTWTDNIEAFPTGTITYQAIPEDNLPQFRNVYGKIADNKVIKIKIEDIDFEVDTFGWVVQQVPFRSDLLTYYDISVELKSAYEDKVEQLIKVFDIVSNEATEVTLAQLCNQVKIPYSGPKYAIAIPEDAPKSYSISISSVVRDAARINGCFISYRKGIDLIKVNSGKFWSLPQQKVKTQAQNTIGPPPVINEAPLEGNFDDNLENLEAYENQILAQFPSPFQLKEPVIEEFIEEDDNVEQPPENSSTLKTVDSNSVDGGGPKKVRRISKTTNGKKFQEVVQIWGFKYTGADLNLPSGADPANFWGLIETQVIDYVYEQLPALKLELTAQNPGGGEIKLLVHQDYQEAVGTSFFGNQITLNGNAKYLTQILGNGNRFVRYSPETADLESLQSVGETDSFLYDFVKVPKISRKRYVLKSKRNLLENPENVNLPFSVTWTKFEDLNPILQQQAGVDNISTNGLVGVVVPDLNYVEPLAILQESESKLAFTTAPYPDAEFEGQRVVAGEETFNDIKRTRVSDSKYKEKITEFTAQNNFEQVDEKIRYRDIGGDFPEADSLIQEWETKAQANTAAFQFATPNASTNYVVNSNLTNSDTPVSPRISAGAAATIAEAETYLTTQLRIDGWTTSVSNTILKWHYEKIKAGDYLNVTNDKIPDKQKVTSVTHSLKFLGGNNPLDQILITSDGSQLTIGRDLNRKVTITKADEFSNVDAEDNPNQTETVQEPKIKVKVIGGEVESEAQDFDIPSRRKF